MATAMNGIAVITWRHRVRWPPARNTTNQLQDQYKDNDRALAAPESATRGALRHASWRIDSKSSFGMARSDPGIA